MQNKFRNEEIIVKKKILSVFLGVVFALSSLSTITAFAASSVSQDGLTAAITSKKTVYSANEDIDLDLTVVNNNSYAVDDIQTSVTLPDGITAKAGSLSQDAFSLAANESKTSASTIIKTVNAPAASNNIHSNSNTVSPKTGDSFNIVIRLIIMLISGGALVLLAIKEKKIKNNGYLSLLLLFAVFGAVYLPVTANAASTKKNFTVSEDLVIDGKTVTVNADISYAYIARNTVVVTGGTGSASYVNGDTVTIVANAPETGYHFAGWTVVSGSATLANDKDSKTTFTMSGNPVELKANYDINKYNISVAVGQNGAISPITTEPINYGGSQKYDITADDGYHIEDVCVDGASVGAVSSYTFDKVTSDHVISATFAKNARSTEEITKKFREYFYDEKGEVDAIKIEGKWFVGVENGNEPVEVFKDITGMDVSDEESYSYKFVSSDGQSSISIVGNKELDLTENNPVYATMNVSIPSCPEIQTVYIINPENYMD